MKSSTLINPVDALKALVNSIQECAFVDRGFGHYVKCNNHVVEINLNYAPVNCDCKDYLYRRHPRGQNCKHMDAVIAFYAEQLSSLQDDNNNPVVSIRRAGRLVRVRWSQLSQNEAKDFYRSQYSNDFHINIYA